MKKYLFLMLVFLSACQPMTGIETSLPGISSTPMPEVRTDTLAPEVKTNTPKPTIKLIRIPQRTMFPTATIKTIVMRFNTYKLRNGTHVISDNDSTDEFLEIVEHQARNLAIATPYHWECYKTSSKVTWDEIVDHYKNKASVRGYVVKRLEFNPEIDMGLMSFGKGNANIYVQFWADDPVVMVIYKNVES